MGRETNIYITRPDYERLTKLIETAPIGTAMLGYRRGEVIEWEVPSGVRRLKVEEVLYQPESKGDYHL